MKDKKSVKREVRVLEARDLMKASGGMRMPKFPFPLGYPSNRHRHHKFPFPLGFVPTKK